MSLKYDNPCFEFFKNFLCCFFLNVFIVYLGIDKEKSIRSGNLIFCGLIASILCFPLHLGAALKLLC